MKFVFWLQIVVFCISDIIVDEFFVSKYNIKSSIYFRKVIQFIVLMISVLDYSFLDFIYDALNAPVLFTLFSFGVALSSTVVGALESYVYYRKNKPKNRILTKKEIRFLIKFGSINGVIKGKGIYDVSVTQMIFSGLCNVLGALVNISILIFLKYQPEYLSFLENMISRDEKYYLVDFLEIVSSLMVLACIFHVYQLQSRMISDEEFLQNPDMENPDTVNFNRWNTNFNMFHFWFALTAFTFFSSSLVMYFIFTSFEHHFHWTVILPMIAGFVYLYHIGNSPQAFKIRATGQYVQKPSIIFFGIISGILFIKGEYGVAILLFSLALVLRGVHLSSSQLYKFRENERVLVHLIPIVIIAGVLVVCSLYLLRNS